MPNSNDLSRSWTRLPDPREVALEIARRAARARSPIEGLAAGALTAETYRPYVIRVSDPITTHERLQLVAARLQKTPVAVMPHKCKSVDEWAARYARRA
jgi:hypothetical protein